MSIYTKKGDKGETGLLGGVRISKDALLIETLGNFDEANCWLGIIGGLPEIQKDLMTISSILAGADIKFAPEKTRNLEKEIDKIEETLPPLKNFIVPKGSLMYGRAVVRRAERSLVKLSKSQSIKPNILSYINRLSDYLFVLARKTNSEL